MFARDYRRVARQNLKDKTGIMIGIFLIYAVIAGAISVIPGVGQIAAILISGPLMIGFYLCFMKLTRGVRPDVPDLFYGIKNNFMEHFLLYFLNQLFIALWSLLFVIPGYFKMYSYAMSYYIIIDHPELSQSEARKASMELMYGHRWRLFCLHFSFFGWIFLSMLTFGILLLWVAPYMQAAEAAFYEDLKTRIVVVKAEEEPETVEEETTSFDSEVQ